MANDPDDRPWRRDDNFDEDRGPPRRDRDDDRDDDRARPRYAEPHRGVLILILGILGFAVCGICGIVAWVMGNSDLKKMSAGRMDPEGRGLTQAGKIIGMVATIFNIIVILFAIAMFVFAFVMAANAPAPKGNNQFQQVPVQKR